ncbi:MAG: efflux RND transporter periplasmic adaptor subunit [Candidatus Gastranaerophilales bacterium]|nr:efflux RND transporter periplasmic adaptor subunit [Candidatus Gastranaerophilales bacterium]
MKKKIIIISLIILALTIGVIVYFLLNKKDNSIIKTYGNIEIRTVDLSFQVSGIIEKIYVEEGDYVKKGQILAKLIDKDYVANYNKAKYLTESSKAQAKEDNNKYKRNLELCKDGTNSKQECDTLLNTKDLSNANYKQNEANLEFQKNQLDYTVMAAPQDGIITTRAQEVGARVNANQNVFVMSLTRPIWVRTYIKETDLGNIKYGKKAYVLTDTIDSKTGKKKKYEGYIGYISPIAEFTPKTVQTQDLRTDLVYRIRVYIDEVDEYLRQGMPVSVEIPLNEVKNE